MVIVGEMIMTRPRGVGRQQVSVTEAGVVAALDGDVRLRTDTTAQLGTGTAVHAAHRYDVISVSVT